MNEDIAITDNKTRIQKIKDFLNSNKKKITITISLIVIIIFGYFIYDELLKKKKIEIANKYNSIILNYSPENKLKVEEKLINIINEKNKAYSPLALYFIIDNNIITEKEKINKLFDIIINKTKLEKEIKNLVIYKKGLFNSEFVDENELIKILNPIVNSDSIWKSHALYLMAEYFYFKNEKQKSKEFYEKIMSLKNSNPNIFNSTQKKLNRNFSE